MSDTIRAMCLGLSKGFLLGLAILQTYDGYYDLIMGDYLLSNHQFSFAIALCISLLILSYIEKKYNFYDDDKNELAEEIFK